jgi:hypothetical protein
MSYHQRPHELRLAISSEAEALLPSCRILAVRPTLKPANAPVRQAAIPSPAIGTPSLRRSLASRASARRCSTPYSVEQADPDHVLSRHGG